MTNRVAISKDAGGAFIPIRTTQPGSVQKRQTVIGAIDDLLGQWRKVEKGSPGRSIAADAVIRALRDVALSVGMFYTKQTVQERF